MSASTACPVHIAVGSALNADPAKAGRQAAKHLKRKLDGKEPSLLIVSFAFNWFQWMGLSAQEKVDLAKRVAGKKVSARHDSVVPRSCRRPVPPLQRDAQQHSLAGDI